MRWRNIPGFDRYQSSDTGLVRSQVGCWGTARGRVLRPWIQGGGYRYVSINRDRKRFVRQVHRLVLMAFVGDRPSPIHQANHKNGNKADNSISNLEWVLPHENRDHAIKAGLLRRGRECSWSKLSIGAMNQIRAQFINNVPSCLICRRWDISRTTLRNVVKGKAWSGVTMKPLSRKRVRPTDSQFNKAMGLLA